MDNNVRWEYCNIGLPEDTCKVERPQTTRVASTVHFQPDIDEGEYILFYDIMWD